jgi:glycosyltransferase involved in cell wall biosynthesis
MIFAQHQASSKNVRVCIDARALLHRGGTGVAGYAQGLADSLAVAGYGVERLTEGQATPGRFRRWTAAMRLRPRAAPHGPTPDIRICPDVFRTAQVHFDLYRRFMRVDDAAPPNIAHWSYPLPLRFRDVPNLYTVHDLIPILHPGLSPIAPSRLRRLLRGVAQAAAHIVTISEATRADLLSTLGWPADQVTAIHQSVDVSQRTAARAPSAVAAATRPLGLDPGEYFLCVGSVEPRKNIARLIEAHRASGVVAPLLLVGPDGWRAARELRGATPGVIRLPWIPDNTLVSLMQGARAVLMPSLAEGFGRPMVEAMSLGIPAMAGASGATAEVAAGAALLVDPLDVRAMAGTIAALDGHAGLRAELATRGLLRAAAFTPWAHGVRLDALYRRIAAASKV